MIDFKDLLEQLTLFLGGDGENAVFTTGQGLLLTLKLLIVSLSVGSLLSIPLAVMRNSKHVLPARTVWLFTYLFRGTPMLVQLFLIYYGLAEIEWVRHSWAWPYLRDAYACSLLTITLNTAAYTTEIIAGQIRATNWGEIEAAKSMGMGKWLLLRRIVLPAALRRALPAYSNEVIMLLHGTSIVSLVTLADLTGVARQIYSDTYNPFEPFLIAGAIYLVLTYGLTWIFKKWEVRWLAYLRPMESR